MSVKKRSSLVWRRAGAIVGLTVLAAAGVVALETSAAANPGPIQQRTATGVTADVLPTTQINGIVWSNIIVGNHVFAGGKFTKARPAGSPAGSNEVTRNNFLSYTLSTGVLDTDFVPNLNGQVLAVAASPDGSTVYVGGDFTTANGQTRQHLAAYDVASGTLLSTFAPNVSGAVNGIAVSPDGNTVYFGGNFGSVNGKTHSRAAAVSAYNGAAVSAFQPTPDGTVNAVTVTPDGSKVILGGVFHNVDGSSVGGGLAAVRSADGGFVSNWTAAQKIKDGGPNAGILALSVSSDKQWIMGVGFSFHGGGNLEGAFLADPTTGALHWIEDCHGDSYGVSSANGVVYVVSHEHFCANVGSFPDTNPRSAWYRSTAFTEATTGTLAKDSEPQYYNWQGFPSPSQINWYPSLAIGDVSGANQAAWTVAANSQYVVEGGEFPSINGVKQQGLVRFAVPGIAPGHQGPKLSGASFTPKAKALNSTAVRVTINTNWDRDDAVLSYVLFRANKGALYATTTSSLFWDRHAVSFIDQGLVPGHTYTYAVQAVDSSGNQVTGPPVTVTTPTSDTTVSPYERAVLADGSIDYWRMNETSAALADDAGFDNMTVTGGVTRGVAGVIPGNGALQFNGSSGTAGEQVSVAGMQTFTEEVWVKTTHPGGKIMGFGDASTTESQNYDRHLYLDSSGHVIFGINPGTPQTIKSSRTITDGNWHYLVAEVTPTGSSLYVDGALAGVNSAMTAAQVYDGYWRLGGDNITSTWPGSDGKYFNGTIDEAAIYPYPLSTAQIEGHYAAAGRSASAVATPTAAFGASCGAGTCTFDASPSRGSGLSYAWQFGDGFTASGQRVSHTYNAPGVYAVFLTVTDSSGHSGISVFVLAPRAG